MTRFKECDFPLEVFIQLRSVRQRIKENFEHSFTELENLLRGQPLRQNVIEDFATLEKMLSSCMQTFLDGQKTKYVPIETSLLLESHNITGSKKRRKDRSLLKASVCKTKVSTFAQIVCQMANVQRICTLQDGISLAKWIPNREGERVGQSELHRAVENDHLELARIFLDLGMNVNEQSEIRYAYGSLFPETPLMLAAKHGKSDIVRMLLDEGADVNLRVADDFRFNETALYAACKADQTDIVRILLQSGARIDTCHEFLLDKEDEDEVAKIDDCSFKTPVSITYENSDFSMTEIFRLLLRGTGSLDVTCRFTYSEVNEDRENSEDNTRCFVWPVLLMAVRVGDEVTVRELLCCGADPNVTDSQGDTALHIAAIENNPKMIIMLINSKADLNQGNFQGETPIMIAAELGHTEIVRILIKKRVNLDLKAFSKSEDEPATALGKAISGGDLTVVEMLLKAGASTDWGFSGNVVFESIYHRQHSCLDLFQQTGVLTKMKNKKTIDVFSNVDPLHYLVQKNDQYHLETLNKVLAMGYPLNRESLDRGYTPLIKALLFNNKEAALALITAGAPVNSLVKLKKNLWAMSAMHVAVLQLLPEVVHALIGAGANVDQPDLYGRSPLQIAAMPFPIRHGWTENMSFPISHGWTENRVMRNQDMNSELLIFSLEMAFENKLSDEEQDKSSEIIYALHRAGAYLETQDGHGTTPLYWAAANDNIAAVRTLLDCGANPTIGCKSMPKCLAEFMENKLTPLEATRSDQIKTVLRKAAISWNTS